MEIQYISHKDIDENKWNNCITNAHNSLIYVHAFYLNNCTNNNWDALVVGNYEVIMPLIKRKKYGIAYLYQPAFLQQAGIFSVNAIGEEIVKSFLQEAAKHFKFLEINLNYANKCSDVIDINFTEKNNYILSLNNSYESIYAKFNNNFKRNLVKSNKYFILYENVESAEELIDLYKNLYNDRLKFLKDSDYMRLKMNCKILFNDNNLVLRKITFHGKICAAVILLKDKKRLYNIAPLVTQIGKKIGANHFLFNKIIEEFSGQDLILDFEGSDINGIASFYKSMNPVNEKYEAVKFNNLPWLVKLFKK